TGTGEVQAQLFRDDKNKAKPQVDGKKKPFFAKKKSNHLDIQTSIEDEYNKQLAEDYYVDDEEEEPYTGEFNFYSTNHKKEDIKPKEKKEPEKTAYFTPPPSEMKEKESVEKPEEEKTDEKKEEKKEHKPYMLPFRMDLLDKPVQSDYGRRMEKSNLSKANLLEEAFQNFHIDVKINNIVIGPSVTRYELTPAPGVKISRITALANDIALYLAAPSVRIEAPIPGKSAVGIEVPNAERMGVKIRELLDTPEFKNNKSSIYFGLGKDINGNNVYGDLAKMPHLLIAGTTGSGKSVCINSIIMSILYKSSPEEVNMLMVDPKVVEMKRFNGIPHMKTKVVTDPKKATSMLNYVVNEMQKRYKIFADTNVKEIDSYNKYMLSQGEKIIPKLVVIIDELADLMMASKHEVEDAICRIAQLGRAAGIHLVVATQTPRADVLTGMIKTNISSRIALTVSSGLDSRIILDMNGAEDLLGNGDMLFMPIGQSKPVRLQGCYISDEENERVIDFLKNNTDEMEKDEELERQLIEGVEPAASISEVGEEQDKSSFDDPLTQKAIELAFEYGNISSSMIMRRLKVGYARAARIVDEMELKEIVPPADGNKPRPLQITYDEFQRMIGKDEEE
ncbi:MAG: DNA translocase FtsK, partial [Clostridia bacterium]|nr:DNA translocase FtsK [Clostridia bacterium]